MKVFVAGLGVISSIGNGVEENFDSLVSGRHGIHNLSEEIDLHLPGFPVGKVSFSNAQLAETTGCGRNWPRAALLSLFAAKEAVKPISHQKNLRIGFISATTVGGMDQTEEGFFEWQQNGKINRRKFVHHECGRQAELVAEFLGIDGFVTTLNTACSSSANSIILASRLIKNNIVDVAIAGGTDALTKFTLNGFSTLLILDNNLCRPFDATRAGLNLGEGAGYLLLAGEHALDVANLTATCELRGYANANDAFHQTASSAEGTGSFLAMRGALESGNLFPSEISYINLHGTGTTNNDASEATAIQKLFEDKIPLLSSTKSFTGHTLGASGGIEAVFSVLSIERKMVYPNLRVSSPMPEIAAIPVLSARTSNISHVLSNSFGFGGNCSSLLFSAI